MLALATPRAAIRALLPLALLFVGPTADETPLVFAPEEGASAVKTFAIGFSAQSVRIGVADTPFEGFAYDLEASETVVVEDTWVSVASGRPVELRRAFVELSRSESASGGFCAGASDRMESPLEGEVVAFAWNDDSKAYDATLVDRVDDDLLEGLVEDIDLRGFLPPDGSSAASAEEWTVPTEAWTALVHPGGDLTFGPVERAAVHPALLTALHEAWKSDLRARSRGLRDVDGFECAVVRVEGKTWSEAELDDLYESGSRAVHIRVDVEIELLWDVERGHLRSAEGSGTFECEYNAINDEDFDYDVSLRGDVTIEVQVEH